MKNSPRPLVKRSLTSEDFLFRGGRGEAVVYSSLAGDFLSPAVVKKRDAALEDLLNRMEKETGVCECADKKHADAMRVYDVAVKHIVRRIRTGVKMVPSCDGFNPNESSL